jgi:hypothetical protein
MSTTVSYKGSTIATVNNNTKTLKTSGKYMEGDVVLTDVSTGGFVTQDQDGFIILPPTGGGTPSASGLVYETGTWTPTEDVASYVISFTNTHTVAPFYYMIADATETYDDTTNSNYFVTYNNYAQVFGAPFYVSSSSFNYGQTGFRYRATNTTALSGSAGYALTTSHSNPDTSGTSSSRYWATETGIRAYSADTRYFRAGRTYKWIAVWAPTT